MSCITSGPSSTHQASQRLVKPSLAIRVKHSELWTIVPIIKHGPRQRGTSREETLHPTLQNPLRGVRWPVQIEVHPHKQHVQTFSTCVKRGFSTCTTPGTHQIPLFERGTNLC
ncbi:hypothetical protein ES332_D06G189700v1 [Gossypium tomentosum]|uniref:Uncharacterized protein n=1 Tax=Gossypium tomentosum TaxID=34277 RepID=A0A5D2KKY4_GOSTO|nr:hypothetical protein ES332_D06G189700v1 [Gossypium tomentosum]